MQIPAMKMHEDAKRRSFLITSSTRWEGGEREEEDEADWEKELCSQRETSSTTSVEIIDIFFERVKIRSPLLLFAVMTPVKYTR